MPVSEGMALSTGFRLSTVLRHKPEFIEQLALYLDREMRLISNWKHLARELGVFPDVIKRLEQNSDFSPTIRLFEFLEVTQPDLTVKQLKDALLKIRRNDLYSLLTLTAECIDTDKVLNAITKQGSEAPLPKAGLLDKIALALDGTSLVLSNWNNLAGILGVPREKCWEFERRSTENPTNRLFQYLAVTSPEETIASLKKALHSMERKDLINFLEDMNVSDDVLLKDIMTPGSEILERMAANLNRKEVPGVKNWPHLAYKLDIPADIYQKFDNAIHERKSPTKEILEWLASEFPEMTLSDVVKALDKIQRNDVIQVVSREFSDTVASALKPLNSSFQHSFSMKANDPGSVTFPASCIAVEIGFLSLEDKKIPSDHCGNLPDRVSLVGREETCQEIMTILDSKKAIEIVAPPGYGKTKVVVEVAYKMKERGMFVAYVNTRSVACVEDLGGLIIEALGSNPGENTIKETKRGLKSIQSKPVLLIIENIDNLLHLEEDQIRKLKEELQDSVCDEYCAKIRGKCKKDDFLTFLKDIGEIPNLRLVLTSRERNDFSVSFPITMFELPVLAEEDSALLFTNSDQGLKHEFVKELVKICGGIPLVISTVLTILQTENPEEFTERLHNSSLYSLITNLCPGHVANEDRIDKCLQVCFDRFNEDNQDVLVMIATFPYRFTRKQFVDVFKSSPSLKDTQNGLSCLKHSSLLCYERLTGHYSLHPFIRNFFAEKPNHSKAKSVFIRHYSKLAEELCLKFLSRDCKSAIDRYWVEKTNIREAIDWCRNDHLELPQTVREECIGAFNKAAIFLAKMMRKQEFELLFCKLAKRCRNGMLHSACLTHIGMKIVLSCTCTPQICPSALYRAKSFLLRALKTQSGLTNENEVTRPQCLSKLGFCYVREGRLYEGFEYLNKAVKIQRERAKKSEKIEAKIMLAACHSDFAASLMVQSKHLLAIEIGLRHVLPVYEKNLGNHPFTATILNCIGNSYHALGDYDNAINYISQSVEIRKQLLGHHQETARSLYDLGVAYSEKNDFERALEYLKEAANLQLEVLDTYDELIHTHQTMSIVLRCLGRNEEAEEEMTRAEESAKKLDSWEAPLEMLRTQELEFDWNHFLDDPLRNSHFESPS